MTVLDACGALAPTTGRPCQLPAGWGTEHVGDGRCRRHPGRPLAPPPPPVAAEMVRRHLDSIVAQVVGPITTGAGSGAGMEQR
jgi:hypothetical protein